MSVFRTEFGASIFETKYAHPGAETYDRLIETLVANVRAAAERYAAIRVADDEADLMRSLMASMKIIPGGRYLYYANRKRRFYNNCFLLRAEEDSREDWAELSQKVESCLMTGGGIGVDYSRYRASGSPLKSTGGIASGPLAKMEMINAIGRGARQGGGRRAAMYASLDANHPDALPFLTMKNWDGMHVAGAGGASVGDLKRASFNYDAPMDMTNISLNYKTDWLLKAWEGDCGGVFGANVVNAMSTGEPGFSFNFFGREDETLRNACTEVTSADDSDVCNLASVNMSRIDSLDEFMAACVAATTFLMLGSFVAELPYPKVDRVRSKNRRIGVGLMGVHEWLIQRGYRYEAVPELKQWLHAYREVTDATAVKLADRFSCARPKGVRAIAPTGTIGILAGTTTGIEPLFAVAYKRRYVVGDDWRFEYVVDGAAKSLIETHGFAPDSIESALDLAADPERRIKFQADVQDYVDQGISSTINLPAWGSDANNPTRVPEMRNLIVKYAHRLRGLTLYPDGARGGQPLEAVRYSEAAPEVGRVYREQHHDICDIAGKGGVCGV